MIFIVCINVSQRFFSIILKGDFFFNFERFSMYVQMFQKDMYKFSIFFRKCIYECM